MKQNNANIKFRIAGIAVELMVTVPDKPVNFNLKIPCPFLDNDSCSIYKEQPLR
jgi:Fe-S-cluster containining protein